MRATQNVLATVALEWLCSVLSPDWFDRYEKRFEANRLPKGKAEQQRYAEQVGADGFHLLQALSSKAAPSWLREVPWFNASKGVGASVLRTRGTSPMASRGGPSSQRLVIHSPYDVDAHFSTKHDILWAGYKVHLTETCDDETPHLITHIETTPATTYGGAVVETIHAALAEKRLLPQEHVVVSGYLDAEVLVTGHDQHAITLIGPVAVDTRGAPKRNKDLLSHTLRLTGNSDRYVSDWQMIAACGSTHMIVMAKMSSISSSTQQIVRPVLVVPSVPKRSQEHACSLYASASALSRITEGTRATNHHDLQRGIRQTRRNRRQRLRKASMLLTFAVHATSGYQRRITAPHDCLIAQSDLYGSLAHGEASCPYSCLSFRTISSL